MIFPTAPFLINPYGKKSIWMPEPYQMLRYPNPSYANSLWLGLAASIVMLPHRLWIEVLRQMLLGKFASSLQQLAFIPVSMLLWAWWGITGKAYAVDARPGELLFSHLLTPEQSSAISRVSNLGHVVPLLDDED